MKHLDDLYGFIGEQSKLVGERYPFWPCKKGCDLLDGKNCCHYSLFPVTKTEWGRVKGALFRLPEATRLKILVAAHEAYRALSLEKHHGPYTQFFQERAQELQPCPLLVDGACSIYADRPVICRTYGSFTSAIDQQAHVCRVVAKTMTEHGVKKLPNADVVSERMSKFVRGPIKPLIAWIVEDAS